MRRKFGFTLIELLIVVALIMILSAVGIGAYTVSTMRSYDTQRKNDLDQMAKALAAFNTDVGRYPLSDTNGKMLCYQKDGNLITNPACVGGKLTIRIDDVVTTYITVPVDADPSYKYVYESTNGSEFSIYTYLHNPSDKDLLLDENKVPLVDPYGVSCGDDKCNYKITEIGLSKTNE